MFRTVVLLLPPLLVYSAASVFMSLPLTSASGAGLSTRLLKGIFGAIPVMILARFSQKMRYWLRVTAYLSTLTFTSFFGVFLSIVLPILGQRRNINLYVARTFYAITSPLVSWKLTIHNEERLTQSKPCVIILNHQSMIDVLILGKVMQRGTSIMAKKELLWLPILGPYLWASRAILVERASREKAIKTFAKAAKEMHEMQTCPVIFVEGTRSNAQGPDLLPFKKGAFHLAVQAQVPIIPVVCENYWNMFQLKNSLFEPGEAHIKVLEPIETKGFTSSHEDIELLSEKAREAMLGALKELAQRPGSCSGTGGVVVKKKE
ncbi:1-acylglycerol-3-phosphate O [Atractiella rhizophila]|nr:1-acylglycerol-3-phosphate O [Atractiella rhizophila]